MTKNRLDGYSLIEISIVLLIIGIVTGAVLKGRSLIESVRLDSVVSDIRGLQMAYVEYLNTYSKIPGNETEDCVFNPKNDNQFFKDLADVGLLESDKFKKPKIGNEYKVIAHEEHPYIQISGLSTKQVQLLKNKCHSLSKDIRDEQNGISVKID